MFLSIWNQSGNARSELLEHPDCIIEIARYGSKKAALIAEETMQGVRQIMGLA